MEKESLLRQLNSTYEVTKALIKCGSVEEMVRTALAEVRKQVKYILPPRDDLKWPITTVETKKDVVSHVKKKVASFYILDNWVVDKNDGLDALEQIKKLDEKAFVAILTGHPSEIIKKQAEKLGANFYKTKTLNLERDIREIIDEKELLKKIREKYPDKPRFFEKVSEYEENIDLPSSYWFDTLELS